MAIQTRGFSPSVLPTYTPVDPSLVAFDASRIGSGINQGLSILDGIRDMRQKRIDREEKNSLAQLRVAAQQAEYLSEISRLPVETQAAVIDALSRIQSAPSRTARGIAEDRSVIARLPSQTQRGIREDSVAMGNADIALSTLPDRATAAQVEAYAAAANAPVKAQTDRNALDLLAAEQRDAITNLSADQTTRRIGNQVKLAQSQADLAKTIAEIDALKAKVQAGGVVDPEDLKQAAARSATLAKNILAQKVPGTDKTLDQYRLSTTNSNGTRKFGWEKGWFSGGTLKNDQAEEWIKSVEGHERDAAEFALAASTSANRPAQAAPESTPAPVPVQQQTGQQVQRIRTVVGDDGALYQVDSEGKRTKIE